MNKVCFLRREGDRKAKYSIDFKSCMTVGKSGTSTADKLATLTFGDR
ncbi:MAG: hypothetical protein LH628_14640 [Microcoleus sp. CAN_BIN18]|nr:hypothetical protein [Microcoleus sp. CAN_BIN18]